MRYSVPHLNKTSTTIPLRVFRGIKPSSTTLLASTCFAMSGSTSDNMSVTRDRDRENDRDRDDVLANEDIYAVGE